MNFPVLRLRRGAGNSSVSVYKTMTKILILLLFFLIVRHSVSNTFAGTVSVENNVSVEANSGGNSAGSGEIIQGAAEAEIKVKTVINGETVQDINIKETSTGTPVIIKKEIKIEQNVEQNQDNKFFKNFFRRLFKWFKFW